MDGRGVRYRSRAGSFTAAVAALSLALVPGVASSTAAFGEQSQVVERSPGSSSQEKTVSHDPFDDPRLIAHAEVGAASDEILHLVDRRDFLGFAGTAVADRPDTVILYWKGDLPAAVSELLGRIRSRGLAVDVVKVPYTLSELDRESRRIAALDPSETGVQITGVGPLGDYSGIKVSVVPDDLERAPEAITSTFRLEFEAMPEVELVDRWNDTSPFWGGAAIDHLEGLPGLGTYYYCTTAFATRRASGNEAMITARHCGTNWEWRTPDNDQYVGTTSSGDASLDATVLMGADYAPHIYAGGVTNAVGRSVVGAANPADESYVFTSGSHSGASTVRVKEVGQYIVLNGTTVGPGFWTKDEELDGSVGEGDSGGPVAAASSGSFNDVVARGMIDAIDLNTQTSCIAMNDGRKCGYRAFHVNIQAILNQMNMTIQKTS